MNVSNLTRIELLDPVASQQNVLAELVEFCFPAFTVSLLSLISLLTYFDVLESFTFFHWLHKASASQKKHATKSEGSHYVNCAVKAEEVCSVEESAALTSVSSAAQSVRLLEADMYLDDFYQQNVSLSRKKYDTLWRDLNQVDNSLLRLVGEDIPVRATQTCEFRPDMKSAPHSSAREGAAEEQRDTKEEEGPETERDAQKVQWLRNRLQPMRKYVEERLQLLKTLSDCLDSYRMAYQLLQGWISSTYQFQEWIHSVECDSDFLIVKNLGHQKRITRDIEEKLPWFDDCLQSLNECDRISKEIQVQSVTFQMKIKPDEGVASGEIPHQASTLEKFHQEFADLKQRFALLVRLTQCYVVHLRDLLRMKQENHAFVTRKPETAKERSGLKTFLKGKRR